MHVRTTEQILDELNNLEPESWVASTGIRALTTVTKQGEVFNFNPSSGTLVKAFYNVKTGEIKMFMALLIKDSFLE